MMCDATGSRPGPARTVIRHQSALRQRERCRASSLPLLIAKKTEIGPRGRSQSWAALFGTPLGFVDVQHFVQTVKYRLDSRIVRHQGLCIIHAQAFSDSHHLR